MWAWLTKVSLTSSLTMSLDESYEYIHGETYGCIKYFTKVCLLVHTLCLDVFSIIKLYSDGLTLQCAKVNFYS